MRSNMVLGILFSLALMSTIVSATPVFYNNYASWRLAAGGVVEELTTDSIGVQKAQEVVGPPENWQELAPVLTFPSSQTGLSRSFTLTTLEPGSSFLFVDDVQHTDRPGLAVGSDGSYENDDWKLEITGGPPVFGFSFELIGNHLYNQAEAESFSVFNPEGELMGAIDQNTTPAIPTTGINESQFIGVLTTEPIGSVVFDEDALADDIIIGDFRFVPEPHTFLLFLITSASLTIKRR